MPVGEMAENGIMSMSIVDRLEVVNIDRGNVDPGRSGAAIGPGTGMATEGLIR
jgi:glucokinase